MKSRGNKYLRRLRLTLKDQRMTLRPPRTGLAIILSVALSVGLLIYALLPYPNHFAFERILKATWFNFAFGALVFYAVSRGFRDRIVFDARERQVIHGKEIVGSFDQIAALEIETAFRSSAMNQLRLLFRGEKRLPILYFDGTPKNAEWEFAEILTDFLKVPLKRNSSKTWFGKKR